MKTKTIVSIVTILLCGTAFADESMEIDFETVDANGDGVISQEEAQVVPGLPERWVIVDSNEDGVLDEWQVDNLKRGT